MRVRAIWLSLLVLWGCAAAKPKPESRRMTQDQLEWLLSLGRIVVEGKETELDRSVIEKIDDPIIHLLRNAIDHGLEMPDERKASGRSSFDNCQTVLPD